MKHRKIKTEKELSETDLQVSRILVELAVNSKIKFTKDFIMSNLDKFLNLDNNLQVVSMAAYMQHQVDLKSKSSILLELMKNQHELNEDSINDEELESFLTKENFDANGIEHILRGSVKYILTNLNLLPKEVLKGLLTCLERIKEYCEDSPDPKHKEVIKDIVSLVLSLREMESSCLKLNKFLNPNYH
jgi:hypothetical protein